MPPNQHAPKSDLNEIEQNLRSARNILLTINVICAFLFVLVFEMIFGWQTLRPSASEKIFVENLARIALLDTVRYNEYEQFVIITARKHCDTILDTVNCRCTYKCDYDTTSKQADSIRGHNDSIPVTVNCIRKYTCDYDSTSKLNHALITDSTEVLRDTLDSYLSSEPIWFRNEYIRSFLNEIDSINILTTTESVLEIKDSISHSIPAKNYMDSFSELSLGIKSIIDDDTIDRSNKTNYKVEYNKALINNRLSFYMQEIRDRFQVNEEARGRKVGRREYSFPIIGTAAQIEDISLPIAIFLVILTYWLYTSLIKANDSSNSYLNKIRKSEYLNMFKNRRITYTEQLIHKLQFVSFGLNNDKFKAKPEYMLGVLFLFMTPYLVVMSSILVNAHEFFVLDVSIHGSDYSCDSATTRQFMTISVIMTFLAVVLYYLAAKSIRSDFTLYKRITKIINDNDEDKNDCENNRLGRIIILLCGWILIAPFVFFGIYSIEFALSGQFIYDYFLKGLPWIIYSLIILFYIIILYLLFDSGKKDGWMNKKPKFIKYILLILFPTPLIAILITLFISTRDHINVYTYSTIMWFLIIISFCIIVIESLIIYYVTKKITLNKKAAANKSES